MLWVLSSIVFITHLIDLKMKLDEDPDFLGGLIMSDEVLGDRKPKGNHGDATSFGESHRLACIHGNFHN